MIPAVTRSGMIEIDRIMVKDLQINLSLMMENAGLILAKLVKKYLLLKDYPGIIIVAGSGNNGAGGITAGRRLVNWGEKVQIWLPKGYPKRKIPRKQLERAKICGTSITLDSPDLKNYLIIDAFIGYNFRGTLEGIAKKTIESMKKCDIISLDIPSGIDSNTGKNYGKLNPIATLTLAWIKTGLLYQSKDKLGDLFLADIGVPSSVYHNDKLFEEGKIPLKSQIFDIYKQFSKNSFFRVYSSKSGWEIA